MTSFNDIKPDLINSAALDDINKLIAVPNYEVHAEWNDNVTSFYESYIRDNLLLIIIIVLLVSFIVIIYLTSQYKKSQEIKEKKKKKHKKTEDEDYQIKYYDSPLLQPESNAHTFDQNLPIDQNNELNDGVNDEINLENISEYHKYLRDSGQYDDHIVDQLEQQATTKLSFNELAKLVMGN